MDRLTALCLLREVLRYPDADLFDLVASGEIEGAVAKAGELAGGDAPPQPPAWTRKPRSLEEWQALHLSTFEVGVTGPAIPVQESFYAEASSASQVIRENFLFYRHFGYPLADDPSPHDSLVKQLGFLAYLESLLGSPETSTDERESLERARDDFLDRHLRPWLPQALDRARRKGAEAFYVGALEALERLLRPAPET